MGILYYDLVVVVHVLRILRYLIDLRWLVEPRWLAVVMLRVGLVGDATHVAGILRA